MKADLHNHSYYSDGLLSPSEVVILASKAGCDLFSLTDHDTTDGTVEAQLEADKVGLNLINGVEISAFWKNMAIHIVGLGVDINNDVLQTGLQHNQELRKIRAQKIALSLWQSGIKDALEKTQSIASGPMLTRTHFAQMLIQEGYCKDMKSVFRKYLTGKKPGGVRVEWRDFNEVINWIQSAGGKAFIAHPFRYRMTHTKIKNLIKDFKQASGDGFEVVNANSSEKEISIGNQWSEDFDLMTSCGSDFHGWPNQRVQIGNLTELPNPKRAVWSYI
ncbi:PHP domain-containing protein [Candidatus Pseudothioglobus singularis]|nr:PHP domain-containing protein [Candidatus Pseudothioglobus singularis]MDB4847784.1 PHP domain-containing protein [Candidatus Pseudothioglobus singularis]